MFRPKLHYQLGLPTDQLEAAAELYNTAFGQHAVAVPKRDKRLELLKALFMPDFAVCALDGVEVVGLAGFNTGAGSLTGGIS